MYKEFILLEKVIKEKAKNRPIYYLDNPGNYGDALIRYGTLKFFRDMGIQYTEIKTFSRLNRKLLSMKFFRKGILIFAGGGAWCNLYNREKIIKKYSTRFKHIIILPSTYEITASIPNTTFFRRDNYESKENMPNSIFCHDMAFYIGQIYTEKGDGKGYFFRMDKESSQKIDIPENNNDISMRGNHLSEIYTFFNEISKFEKIYTDRLHVAIAGSLMNKEVYLYPASYFKSRAIYMSSIKNFFEKTSFYKKFSLEAGQ